MQIPPPISDERNRLTALHSLGLLDTPAEERFDRITRLAQQYFGVKIALICLVDSDRQWFKSKQGIETDETARDISFCGHAIQTSDVFVVEDTLLVPITHLLSVCPIFAFTRATRCLQKMVIKLPHFA
jgi:GAF domain-containing protein